MGSEREAARFGPAWEGWESYRQFADSVTTGSRYVRDNGATEFLEILASICDGRTETIPKESVLWRARLGHEYRRRCSEDGKHSVSWDEECPYSQRQMKPIANWSSEGRANPRGIPYLYLATTRDTALAEVRPWIGSKISVGQFRVRRDLKIIDCSRRYKKEDLSIVLSQTHSRDDGIWMAVDRAFATPVAVADEVKNYIPTQIIAELFKSKGLDGVAYKSLLTEDGLNVALFDLNDAGIEHCALYRAASIRFDFQTDGPEYFANAVADAED